MGDYLIAGLWSQRFPPIQNWKPRTSQVAILAHDGARSWPTSIGQHQTWEPSNWTVDLPRLSIQRCLGVTSSKPTWGLPHHSMTKWPAYIWDMTLYHESWLHATSCESLSAFLISDSDQWWAETSEILTCTYHEKWYPQGVTSISFEGCQLCTHRDEGTMTKATHKSCNSVQSQPLFHHIPNWKTGAKKPPTRDTFPTANWGGNALLMANDKISSQLITMNLWTFDGSHFITSLWRSHEIHHVWWRSLRPSRSYFSPMHTILAEMCLDWIWLDTSIAHGAPSWSLAKAVVPRSTSKCLELAYLDLPGNEGLGFVRDDPWALHPSAPQWTASYP